jgi:hypothetical protein
VGRVKPKVIGTAVGVLIFALFGVFLAVRYGDRGRTERLEKCINTKRILMEDGLKEIGLGLGEPEIWLANPEREEYATFPIEGEKPGEPKRSFRVHTGDGPAGGESFCRAGMIDEGTKE